MTVEHFDLHGVALSGVQLVEASAGTGKTWSSTALYLRLVVEKGHMPAGVLMVTFTRAATQELAGRIRNRLRDMRQYLLCGLPDSHPEKAFCKGMADHWRRNGVAVDMACERLQGALRTFDQAAVYTIHSFCQRLLAEHAFECGAPFDLVPLADERAYVAELSEDVWRQAVDSLPDSASPWADKIGTPSQWLEPLLPHVDKIDIKVLDGPPPDFSDMRPEISAVLDAHQHLRTLWDTDGAAIQALFEDLLDRGLFLKQTYDPAKIPRYLRDLQLVLQGDPLTVSLGRNMSNRYSIAEMQKRLKAKFSDSLQAHEFFDAMSDYLKAREALPDRASRAMFFTRHGQAQLVRALHHILPTRKSEAGVMAFSDMLVQVHQALSGPRADSLKAAVRAQFGAALIDEFQDTDPIQYQIFRQLFADQGIPLFYVGDPKQAIYRFRGADVHAYLEAASQVDKKLVLDTNYRSTGNMVAAINTLFGQASQPFMIEGIDFQPCKAHRPRQAPVVAGQSVPALQFLTAPAPDSGQGIDAQRDWVALDTALRVQHWLYHGQLGGSPVRPGDIAILVPTHRHAERIRQALMARQIRSVRHEKRSLFQTRAAATLLRLLRVLVSPTARNPLFNLLGDPLLGLPVTLLDRLVTEDALFDGMVDIHTDLQNCWYAQGFGAMFQQWLNIESLYGQTATLPERLAVLAEGERHLTDLLHLGECLQSQARQLGGPMALLHWLEHSLVSEEAGHDLSTADEMVLRLESDADRVQIVTIHSSKGLEYPLVFLPFAWDASPPRKDPLPMVASNGERRLDLGSDLLEEHQQQVVDEVRMERLRLLYVALTRAVYGCQVHWFGSDRKGYPSHAALAWVLHARQDESIEAFIKRVEKLSHADMLEKLHALSGEDEIGVDEQPALAASLPQVDGIDPCGELQSAAFQQSHWPSCWWQSSFSALVRGQQVHLADQPELSDHSDDADTVDSVEDAPGQCHDIFHLPRGANTGECLHAIFEHWDFNASHEHQQDALILRFLSRYDIGDIEDRFNWVPPVMQMVKACLAHPLSGGAGPLKNVPASRQQAEMGFLMHAETSLSQIRDGLLAIPDWPEPFREACQQLSEKQLRGFLKGFIDLTFQDDQGRYHVLDWKSNHLGYRPQDYGQDAMEKAMAEHHYYLQAIIYLLALHRWLGQRLTDYAPEQHLGDAWYLFVRGVNGTPDHGVYRMSLSPDQIRTLDNLLSGEVRAA